MLTFSIRMDLYQEQLIDLAKHPLHRKSMPDATLTHSGVNVTCGDHVRLYVKTEGAGATSRIVDASWEGEGCAIMVASASLLTEQVRGMTLEEVRGLTNASVFEWLGIPALGPARVKCAALPLETLQGV